ncbi:MAG: EamA family transporter [Deltaproteobacteria bacterium]|nr:EamA family transporter [Deltaproteobacteria bacterium]MBW2192360.1 EamA family transporter [Deltaproteobacteria bacterium]
MIIYVKLLMTALFWGGTFIAGRIIAKDVGPFSAAFLRFAIASVFLIFFTWKVERKLTFPEKGQIIPIILLGLTGVFSYNVFFFKGLKLINAGRAAIIIANNPILIAIFSAYFFKEKLNLMKVIGITVSVAGAIVVISKGNLSEILHQGIGWGEIFIFGCVLSWVAYSLIGKTVMKNLSPLAAVSYSAVIGTVLLFVPAYFEGVVENLTHYPARDWLSLFYLGFFGTVIGFVWYYEGIKKIGPTKASLFINFVPISAVLLAFLILGEPITPSLFIGTLLVTIGVYLTTKNPNANID